MFITLINNNILKLQRLKPDLQDRKSVYCLQHQQQQPHILSIFHENQTCQLTLRYVRENSKCLTLSNLKNMEKSTLAYYEFQTTCH